MSDARFSDEPKVAGAIDMLRRTGAATVGFRYQDDEEPTVWVAVATWPAGRADAAGGMNPIRAILRLCEQVVDGGTCTHCARVTGFSDDFRNLPLAEAVCWYAWDPELRTFRRGCE